MSSKFWQAKTRYNRTREVTKIVRLIDDDGKDVTDYNVRGELCVRGPSVIKGYFENPKANAESWDSEGYLKTGDVVYCDGKSRKWYIVDRKKVHCPI
jgi:4-coumarate--CoA ligase